MQSKILGPLQFRQVFEQQILFSLRKLIEVLQVKQL